jgi:ribonuclease HI
MHLIIKTDGGARGNPGPAGAGVIISRNNGPELFAGGFFLGNATNNVAEYVGIVRALELASQLGGTKLEIFCDSELVVKQINGQYRVKNDNLRKYYRQIIELRKKFPGFTISHIYRQDNKDADAMVNQALDAEADIGGFVRNVPE